MAKTGYKITKNTLALVLREALNKGALFILLVLVGRFLGKEALGRYSLALVISQIFFFGTELGLNTLIIREVAKDKDRAGSFLFNVGIVRVLLGLATMGLISLTVLALGAAGETAKIIYLCALSYFFISITGLFTSIFRAFEKMELDLFISAVKAFIFLPAAVWVLLNNFGLIAVFNIFLVSNLAALLAAVLIFLKKIGPPGHTLDVNFCKRQLIHTSPLWLSQLFGITYLKIAPILLFRLKGEGAVGLYNAGLVVVDGFWVTASCFILSLFPVISSLSAVSLTEAKKGYLKGLKFLFLVSAAAGIMLIFTARYVVPVFYGAKFIEIVPLFRLMVLIAILVVLDTHNSLTMVAIGRQFVVPFINAAALLMNYVLNLVLIVNFSYIGSAYALLVSEMLVFILMMTALRKFLLRK